MECKIRPMELKDIAEAERLFHVAFGTFLGLPEPASFGGDKDLVTTRWRGKSAEGLVAELDGTLAGSNMLTRWGSFAFFGPLTIRPDLWDRGIAKNLLAATMDVFDSWALSDAGLFTFPHSVKHVGLYQKFGFWPRALTAMMVKAPSEGATGWSGYSKLTASQRAEAIRACAELADSIHSGLDLSSEIESVFAQNLGETVLLWNRDALDGFAVCHAGAGTEGGSAACYVKFAAARDGASLDKLVRASEAFAAGRGVVRMEVGVNTARRGAYQQMLSLGYRNQALGVAMQKPDREGFCRPDAWILDDWR
jgi:GNAT superfamily N-acetyltransferase